MELDVVARSLKLDEAKAVRQPNFTEHRGASGPLSPTPSSIYSASDSDYVSVDFDFLKDKLLSPIKMDNDMAEGAASFKRQHPDPLELSLIHI